MEGGERRRNRRRRPVTSSVVIGGETSGVAREGEIRGEEARICPGGDTKHYPGRLKMIPNCISLFFVVCISKFLLYSLQCGRSYKMVKRGHVFVLVGGARRGSV